MAPFLLPMTFRTGMGTGHYIFSEGVIMDNHSNDFIDKLVHDIRTPLTTIGFFLATMLPEIQDEDGKELHEATYISLEKVKKLIDSLDAYAKTAEGSPKAEALSKGPSDIIPIIRNVLTEIRPLAKRKGTKVSLAGPDHLLCQIDPLAIERIITNLVKNAIEAMDKTAGYVNINLLQQGDGIVIDIRDNGAGIALDNLSKVFDKGFTHGKEGGAGIGLAYCKETIEAQGGTLTAYSEQGAGTLFSISIPSCVVAACNKAPALLQIYMGKDNKQRLNMWISLWKRTHKISNTENVSTHMFMDDYNEDSLGNS